MSTSLPEYLKSAVEAILFISEKPVTLEQLKEVVEDAGAAELKSVLAELMREYEDNRRGMTIVEIAGGYQMLSSAYYAEYIRNFFKVRVKEKLSRPALETLAIVSYKQPVSRADIELIRGVNSDGVVVHLLSKGLIKIVGRKDVPGRPYLYGTTKLFLEYFGLKALDDLPRLEEVSALVTATEKEGAAILPVTEAEAQAEQQALESQVRSQEDAQADRQLDEVLPPGARAGSVKTEAPDADSREVFSRGDAESTAVEPVGELKQAMEEMNKSDEEQPRDTDAAVSRE